METSERKVAKKFVVHSNAVAEKELALIHGETNEADLWLSLHQYLLAVGPHSTMCRQEKPTKARDDWLFSQIIWSRISGTWKR